MKIITIVITTLLSYIIPKKKNLYIFGGMRGNFFSGNTKSLFLYLSKTEKYKLYYFINNDKLLNYLENKGNNFIKGNSLKGYFLLLRAEYIFIDEGASTLSYPNRLIGKFKIINLWHGDGIKDISGPANKVKNKFPKWLIKILYYIFSRNYILIIACSDYWKNILKKSFLFVKNIKITGLPRNDVFFSDNLEFYNIKEKFGLNNYKKVILYAPTHRKFGEIISPFSNLFLDKLNNFCKENNYLFLINKHRSAKKIIVGNYTNIKDISEEIFDIQELLKYTDILITDYSSIFVDYLLLDRSVLFYAYDLEEYKKGAWGLTDKYENLVIKKGICYDENQLLKLLKNKKLFVDKVYSQQFQKLKNKFHKYQNGGYCEKVLKEIKNL